MFYSSYKQRFSGIGWLPTTDELKDLLENGKIMRIKHLDWIRRDEYRRGKPLYYEAIWITYTPECWYKKENGEQLTGAVAHITKTQAMLIQRHFGVNTKS